MRYCLYAFIYFLFCLCVILGMLNKLINLYFVRMLYFFIAGQAWKGFKVQLLNVLSGTLTHRQLSGQDARDD